MSTRLPLLLLLFLGLFIGAPVRAANYSLPGNLPPDCSGSNGSYVCGTALTLAAGDTLSVGAPKPATLHVQAALTLSNQVLINAGGAAADLTLIVDGNLDLGSQTVIQANIKAMSGSGAGTGVVIGGSVTSVGAVTLGPNSSVAGSITSAAGAITLGRDSVVSGSITSDSGAVLLGRSTHVNGSINTEGAVGLDADSRVDGAISAGAGAVSVGANAQVTGSITTNAGAITFGRLSIARACVRSTDSAAITLGAGTDINGVCCGSACSTACAVNNEGRSPPPACSAQASMPARFDISGAGAALTCAPQTLTLSARDSNNNTLTGYTGNIALSTSSGYGDWQVGGGPAPAGAFSAWAANGGQASFRFVAADQGSVTLSLRHSLAQNLTVRVRYAGAASAATSSATLQFRDNAFAWTEDLADQISGSQVAVAGRNHDLQIALLKKDPSSGSCGVATDYSGSRHMKLWRSDRGGVWAAPAVVLPAVNVPAARPQANNLSLNFSAGLARFDLASTDIGKYTLTLEDDSLSYAASPVIGSLTDLTVRPFTLVVSDLRAGGSANPNGSAASDGKFGVAGANFSATLAAYRWSSAADANNDGLPDSPITLTQATAGGLAAGFNSASTLSLLSGSQTPTSGVLGQLLNATVGSFSGGSATVLNLQYTEVGSFLLNGSAWVNNFLGTPGVNLDGLVFNASGAQNSRVGRFVPADFALSAATRTHRVAAACLPASSFSYLGENFSLGFTLTARNALAATTLNYSGDFAKLDPTTAGAFQLAGIQGRSAFKTGGQAGQPARLALGSSSGSWAQGVAANITLVAQALRATAPDGPFDNAQFGIAPVDSDGVAMAAAGMNLDLDPDTAVGPNHARIASLALRYGRLRLQNGIGSQDRPLKLPLLAQYWTPNGYQTNTLDSCSSIAAAQLSFGNFRKALSAADLGSSNNLLTLNKGQASLTLAKPASGHRGSVDVAISLGAGSADASCLQPWAPGRPATAGANLGYLRGNWCGASRSADPNARATFGLYRGTDAVVYQRENY